MSIQNTPSKIKSFFNSDTGRDVLTVSIIVLVGISSFFFGMLAERERSGSAPVIFSENLAPYKLENASDTVPALVKESVTDPVPQPQTETPTAQTGKYMASKNGTRYYPEGCPNRIKEENKVFFNTEAEAQAAGYTLATACQ